MENRKVTPEEVVELVKRDGETITIEQAQIVLDFMYTFDRITLEVLLDENGSKDE